MSKEVYTDTITAIRIAQLKEYGYEITVQVIRHDFMTPKNEYFTPSEDITCYLYHNDEIVNKERTALDGRWSKRKEVFEIVAKAVEMWHSQYVWEFDTPEDIETTKAEMNWEEANNR